MANQVIPRPYHILIVPCVYETLRERINIGFPIDAIVAVHPCVMAPVTQLIYQLQHLDSTEPIGRCSEGPKLKC